MFKNDKKLLDKAAFNISLARKLDSEYEEFCKAEGVPFTAKMKAHVAEYKGKLLKDARKYLAQAQERVDEEVICLNTEIYRDSSDSYMTREWLSGDFDDMSKEQQRKWAEGRRDMGERIECYPYSPTGLQYCSFTYLVKYGKRGWAQISEYQYDV